jgi:predicted RNA binding protein YcfA (HicA-like mRNA interferase family)
VNYRDLCLKLKGLGFTLFREGSKHEIWFNGRNKVTVPRKKIVNLFTAKRILKDAERSF